MIWVYGVIIFLAVVTVFAFIHAHTKRITKEERAASNARILRELKRIAIYQPEKIIRL